MNNFHTPLRQASVLDLTETFGEASFDAVVSTQVLEHVPEWIEAVRQMDDVLGPPGGAAGRPRTSCIWRSASIHSGTCSSTCVLTTASNDASPNVSVRSSTLACRSVIWRPSSAARLRRLEVVDVDAVHVQPLGKRSERLPDVERLAQPAAADVENAKRAALPQLGPQVEDQADLRGTARHARQVEPEPAPRRTRGSRRAVARSRARR